MSGNRILYQNWIVERGLDPHSDWPLQDPENQGRIGERSEQIRAAVQCALGQLEDEERELIVRHHIMGESIRRIARQSGRDIHRVESLHHSGMGKLRKMLAPMVKELFGVETAKREDCPVCSSAHFRQLERIIRDRDRRQTWQPIMRLFRRRYNLVIKCPQVLVGHERYH